MNIKEFLATKPEDLAARQKKELKSGAIAILQKVIHHIKKDEFDNLLDMVNFSPAGDGHGSDNNYIDFSDVLPDNEGDDIGSLIGMLRRLQKMEQG